MSESIFKGIILGPDTPALPITKEYNPDQPRDENGRFGSGGGGGGDKGDGKGEPKFWPGSSEERNHQATKPPPKVGQDTHWGKVQQAQQFKSPEGYRTTLIQTNDRGHKNIVALHHKTISGAFAEEISISDYSRPDTSSKSSLASKFNIESKRIMSTGYKKV